MFPKLQGRGREAVEIDAETMAFLTQPVMLIIASADTDRRPSIARAIGLVPRGSDVLDLIFSRWQWPTIAHDVEATGRLAVTASRPSDYVTYQFKGRAELRDAGAEEVAIVRDYCAAVIETLKGQGVPDWMVARWTIDRDLAVARLNIDEAYVQTPGPRAGTSL